MHRFARFSCIPAGQQRTARGHHPRGECHPHLANAGRLEAHSREYEQIIIALRIALHAYGKLVARSSESWCLSRSWKEEGDTVQYEGNTGGVGSGGFAE